MQIDWTCYTVKPGASAAVLQILQAQKPATGLYGVLHSVLGARERIWLMTPARAQSDEERRADLLASEGIFAPATHCSAIETSRFVTLEALAGVTEGAFGPLFEIRSYELQAHEALGLAEQGWAAVLDSRLSLRPITAVMHSVSGLTPRLVHIYPYENLEQRIEIRNQAIATGKWPPKGGAGRNQLMATELALAAPFSTMR